MTEWWLPGHATDLTTASLELLDAVEAKAVHPTVMGVAAAT